MSTLGVATGTLVHVAAAALGVSALLASSAMAFSVLKYLGAAYLVYLGIRRLLERDPQEAPRLGEPVKLGVIFRQGVIVNVLNPKTALFFFAFLPQFVDVSRGYVTGQLVLLGVIFVVLGILSDGLYAVLAGTAGSWLKGHLGWIRAQRYFSGTVFIGLGVAMAFVGQDRK